MNDFPDYEAAHNAGQGAITVCDCQPNQQHELMCEHDVPRDVSDEMVNAALGADELLRESYPNPDDGSALSPEEADDE